MTDHASEGCRTGFLDKCLLEAWGTKAQQPNIFRNMCGLWALVPQASEKRHVQQITSASFGKSVGNRPPAANRASGAGLQPIFVRSTARIGHTSQARVRLPMCLSRSQRRIQRTNISGPKQGESHAFRHHGGENPTICGLIIELRVNYACASTKWVLSRAAVLAEGRENPGF